VRRPSIDSELRVGRRETDRVREREVERLIVDRGLGNDLHNGKGEVAPAITQCKPDADLSGHSNNVKLQLVQSARELGAVRRRTGRFLLYELGVEDTGITPMSYVCLAIGNILVCRRRSSYVAALEPVSRRETRSRQKELLLIPPTARPLVLVRAKAVDIVHPVFSQLRVLDLSRVRLPAKATGPPRKEPSKGDGHRNFDVDDANNEHERKVEHNLERNTSDTARVDKPVYGKVLETVSQTLLR
jgi:hypothetical protein